MPEAATKAGGWTTAAFGDVVRQVKDKVDPEDSGLVRYVAGEHMDTDDLRIRRWGVIGDGYLGPAFHMRFKPGHVLYGSRRTYLRKVALADFEGITANTTYVLESKDPNVLLPEMLPFVMQTEAFHAHSKRESKGSVNPYVNFSDLAWYEFALPPPREQRRIVKVLQAVDEAADRHLRLEGELTQLFRMTISAMLNLPAETKPELSDVPPGWRAAKLEEVASPDRPISYGILKPGDEDPNGVPMLRVLDFDEFGFRTETVPSTVAREVAETSKTTYLCEGDVIVSIMATIGRAFLVPAHMSGWNINRALAVVPSGPEVGGDFVEAYLQSAFVQRLFEISQIGSAQSRINLEFLKALPVPVPPEAIRLRVVEERRKLGAAIESTRTRRTAIQQLKKRFLGEAMQ